MAKRGKAANGPRPATAFAATRDLPRLHAGKSIHQCGHERLSSTSRRHGFGMTSVDFAAAQRRAVERRQARINERNTRRQAQSSGRALKTSEHLPYPFNIWVGSGIRTWDSIKGRDGTQPAFRVGQVDAELLDEELLELLRNQAGEALKYFGTHLQDDWSSELLLGLRVILFKLSIWDHNASYGAALQNLQYTDARHHASLPIAPSRWQKVLYGLLSIGGRYGWEKWDIWLADREGNYETVGTGVIDGKYANLEQPTPRIRLLSRLSSLASSTHSVAAFVSFLIFLVNGRYRTLTDRLLRLRLISPSNHLSRQVSFEYLNRQLVWHAFTEFLLFLLPLVGITRWRRWLSKAWRKARILVKPESDEQETAGKGELGFLPERTCAICYQDQNPTSTSENEVLAVSGASGGVVGSAQTDITNPYEMVSCGCTYCFVCAVSRLEASDGDGWICLRCGELVKECKPWAGDVRESPTLHKNKKMVSFSDEDKKQGPDEE
ncbi:MAG: hypothetical protein Q9174_004433 [Haloplaca sp. 1 TL-2023]